ncbi:inhibitor of apoptosis-promoting Bax1 protein (macronuclear) [Tetrahymena thermophila SB210]|uniref:Inhibitor of apoptosis-promoting Bax1 protein n=1 Tax=Tetrahymena thermophila (strain SB210) TaxID=312017 RepID=I7MCD8_TETTS|nr:inhibitor of apoptosis-promoting Bax1 protein [Tetrahymena thermophila SB210]EAR83337.2 inhibitor of apoptosis-promoting Bax1 protein [Tetrahymena thermophila SB210]|eukprot:XP_001031000.2 inhibitor of apoptosis-promoting Bax1 protein [Tetrahymena thermophila SB210]
MDSFSQTNYSQENQYQESQQHGNILKNVRLGFVRKVFSILSIQLAFTALMIFMSQQSRSFRLFQAQNVWLFTLSTVLTVAISIGMYCVPALTKKVPINYFALGLFTVCEGYTVSAFTLQYSKLVVLQAGFLTAGATILLFLYACTTKKDVTIMNSSLFMFISSLLLVSIMNFFFRSELLVMLIQYATVLIYSFYLIYDIQIIMGDKTLKLDIDNYILGSLIIYIDIIKIFLKVLQLLGQKEEKEKERERKK